MASLPKHVIEMIEKGNLVKAITALSEDKNIGMGEAKALIDAYEESLKTKQYQKVQSIAQKQGKQVDIDSLTTVKASARVQVRDTPAMPRNIETTATSSANRNASSHTSALNDGLTQHLKHIDYKKPPIRYWVKRLAGIIAFLTIVLLAYLGWVFL